MAFFQSLGIVSLLIIMSSNHTRYGIMASLPIFSMAPEMPSGPTDLFLPVIANHFLIMLILMVKGSSKWVESISGITDRRCRQAFRRYKMRTESPNMDMYLLYLDQVSYNAISSLYCFFWTSFKKWQVYIDLKNRILNLIAHVIVHISIRMLAWWCDIQNGHTLQCLHIMALEPVIPTAISLVVLFSTS